MNRNTLTAVEHADLEAMAKEVTMAIGSSNGNGTIYAALRDAMRMGREYISYAELQKRQIAENEAYRKMHPELDFF